MVSKTPHSERNINYDAQKFKARNIFLSPCAVRKSENWLVLGLKSFLKLKKN